MRRPRRIQLSRARGWRKPERAIVVARPSRWGNPYRIAGPERLVGPDGSDIACHPGTARDEAVARFERDLRAGRLPFTIDDIVRELAGHDLGCWCPLEDRTGRRVPCHADVLLEIANQ